MNVARTDEVKLAETWAEKAITTIRAIETSEAMADWIVDNGWRLGDCNRLAFEHWQRIRAAIEERWKEITA